jgi:hypothetical protein
MKTVSAALLLVCLTSSGAALAASCGTANVPAATLLVPYFRVSRNGATDASPDIPDALGQTETLVAITNVSANGLVVHATVWNKYGIPVLGFNIPMTAYDVVTFRMKDVLNGKLNVNPNTQNGSKASDPCGLNQQTGLYAPSTIVSQTHYVRFRNPSDDDAHRAISRYQTPAFSTAFRRILWKSLDESGDVTGFGGPGANVLDADVPACVATSADGDAVTGDFSGYVTFDVVNYCTTFFPTQGEYYADDAIATLLPGYSPNAIIGDSFYLDSSVPSGHISGSPMVALEFEGELTDWNQVKTFYGRYRSAMPADDGVNIAVPSEFRWIGDGREALSNHYAFRYLNDDQRGLRSWAVVWRSDTYNNPDRDGDVDLCDWWSNGGPRGFGLYDDPHMIGSGYRYGAPPQASVFDEDENMFVFGAGSCCPRPGPTLFAFLETQRIDLLNQGEFNPGGFKSGWADVAFPGFFDNQTWVGIQHSGRSQFLSVGHAGSRPVREACALVRPGS